MLKEYIKKIQKENNEKLTSLEQEMQELVSDLNCKEKFMEKLQHDKLMDTNIFSPRTIDLRADDKIEETQKKINEIKQRMEYVSQMIEEAVKQREELLKLEEEAKERQKEESIENISENKVELENDTWNQTADHIENERKEPNHSVDEDHQLSDTVEFLDSIYKKTEAALAFLNGNKNRSKTELKGILVMIRDYAKKLENYAD